MKFGPVPIGEAVGHVLGHNVSDPSGRRALRKGRSLDAADVELLRTLGRTSVYVARLEPGDLGEDVAAERIAAAVSGPGLRRSPARTGRVNVYARAIGVLRADAERLAAINAGPGVALATLPTGTAVRVGRMVATLKVVPFALPGALVERLAGGGPALRLDPIPPRRIGVILSGAPGARERVTAGYLGALEPRLEALGARLDRLDYVPLEDAADEQRLAAALAGQLASGVELILLAGETAIQDRHDMAPRAIERIDGEIAAFGAPVDPGNLLLLAYRDGVPIVGAPGCARSPKTNIVDLVLPRLLAGERLDAAAIVALGHGGLLEDVPERPSPRSRSG